MNYHAESLDFVSHKVAFIRTTFRLDATITICSVIPSTYKIFYSMCSYMKVLTNNWYCLNFLAYGTRRSSILFAGELCLLMWWCVGVKKKTTRKIHVETCNRTSFELFMAYSKIYIKLHLPVFNFNKRQNFQYVIHEI